MMMYKKTKFSLNGVVRHSSLRILFILFLLFTFHSSLFARDALPSLVEKGEVFDERTSEENFYIDKSGEVNSVTISQDAKYIVSGLENGSVKVWDRESGRLLKILEGHTRAVRSVAISQDVKYIVSGSEDKSVKVWERESGKLLETLDGHILDVYSVAISEDSQYIVSGSRDNSVKIWERESGKLLTTLTGHKSIVTSVAISKDARYIVSGSADKSVKIWERESGKLLKSLEDKFDVYSVAISEDSQYIVSGSGDSNVKIWERESGKLLKTLTGHKRNVGSIAISKDAQYIVSGSVDKSIKIWERESGKLLKSLEGHTRFVNSVAISTDGKFIVSGSWDNSVKIWERKSGKVFKILNKNISPVNSIVISNDKKYIVSGSDDKSVRIWDRKSGTLLKSLEGHTNFVTSVAISNDGKFIVSGSDDKSIKIWENKSGKLLKTLEGHTGSVNSVAISQDAKYIVSGAYDNSIKIWESKRGKLLKTLEGDGSSVTSVAISNDDRFIVSGLWDGRVQIWESKSGKLLKTLKGHTDDITSVAISSDSKFIVSSSNFDSVKIWERKSGKLLKTLEGNTRDINSVAISNDTGFIALGSSQSSIKISELRSGELLKTLEWDRSDTNKGDRSYVNSVAISNDGMFIVSGSEDGSIKIWNIKQGKLLKELRGGKNGCWQNIDFKTSPPIFYRGDDGTFLLKKRELYKEGNNTSYAFKPAYPLDYNLLKKDNLKIQPLKNKTMLNGRSLDLNISIKNQGQTSYAIQAYTDSNVFTLEQNILSVIKKGEEKILHFKVYANLARVNPKPLRQEKLRLRIVTGNGSEFNTSVPISVRFASVEVESAKVSEDGKTLNVNLINSGNEPIEKAKVRLFSAFDNNSTQTIVNLKPNSDPLPVPFAIKKGFKFDKNTTASLRISIANEEEILKNPSGIKVAPAYVWQIDNVAIELNKWTWHIYLLLAWIVLIVAIIIWFYKRYKNPLVVKLSENPKELLALKIEELKEAKERLNRVDRFKNILSENSITEERYDNAITFETLNQEEKARFFAKRVFAKVTKLSPQSYMLKLNDEFPLNVQQFILFMNNKESVADMMSEIKEIPQYSKNIFFILSDNSTLQAKIAHEKGHEKFVRVQPKTLTKLLLAEDGAKVLAKSFAEQLALTQISPYKLGGGESNSSMFFGRREIISHVVGRGNNNYIVIGSRQIGKSSLLKAIEREYLKNQEKVHYISVGKGNLLRAMSRALGVKVNTLEELVAHIATLNEKVLFLLDEVDPFIKNERESGYKVLDSFRKLSEEGSCNFILAGYWELYFYTMFDNQSPLKNFGEAIELGALDVEACREMITQPMEQLGLSFESLDAINEIVERTGQRPNLIAIICNNIIKSLGKKKRVVSMNDVQEAIKGQKVYELFESWKTLDEDKEASKLDKIIVYSMVEQGSFRLKVLFEKLKELGLNIEMNKIENSLARLKVSYTIERDEEGVYGFMLPLFREYILRDDYEVKLKSEVEGYLG